LCGWKSTGEKGSADRVPVAAVQVHRAAAPLVDGQQGQGEAGASNAAGERPLPMIEGAAAQRDGAFSRLRQDRKNP